MSNPRKVPFTDFVEENIEAISFAKASRLGFSVVEVTQAIEREASEDRCQIIGKSDTHLIVAWDDEAPFIITINDFEKYAGDVSGIPLKKGESHG